MSTTLNFPENYFKKEFSNLMLFFLKQTRKIENLGKLKATPKTNSNAKIKRR